MDSVYKEGRELCGRRGLQVSCVLYRVYYLSRQMFVGTVPILIPVIFALTTDCCTGGMFFQATRKVCVCNKQYRPLFFFCC